MRKIITKVSIILSIIFISISICGMSTIDCLNGIVPVQWTITLNVSMLNAMRQGDINLLSYKLIPFFYIALILIFLSSILNFTKNQKRKSIATIVISCIPVIYVIMAHDYILFLILFNIYLFLHIIINNGHKNKFNFGVMTISAIICLINIIELVMHLTLDFNVHEFDKFQKVLINISRTNLICFVLWMIPYAVLMIREILIQNKFKDWSI